MGTNKFIGIFFGSQFGTSVHLPLEIEQNGKFPKEVAVPRRKENLGL